MAEYTIKDLDADVTYLKDKYLDHIVEFTVVDGIYYLTVYSLDNIDINDVYYRTHFNYELLFNSVMSPRYILENTVIVSIKKLEEYYG